MAVQKYEKIRKSGDIFIFGSGSLGGKGEGLVQINQWDIPQVRKLKSRILSTTFYDSFLHQGMMLGAEELGVLREILSDMGDEPIGVRSSATNEASLEAGKFGPVHAGENISFMIPNNHPDEQVRFEQLVLAVYHIYKDFIQKQSEDSKEKMAVIINPIPGLYDDTLSGPFYYPYISGVANSFFPYALKSQDKNEGFARIAFGHGYATVLDDFPVICMATIKQPIPLRFMRMGQGQQYFYALDMSKNSSLSGEELETMKTLHVRFANYHKIKRLGIKNNFITIEELIQNDHYGFKSGLNAVMDFISGKLQSHFQIEFVFNIDFGQKEKQEGYFHMVQLTYLPKMQFTAIHFPENPKHEYLSIKNLQGHGVVRGINKALVVSPFVYKTHLQEDVRKKIAEINMHLRRKNEKYIMIVPGRLGSTNKEWGIEVAYRDVNQAAGIFEYGVDVYGRAEPLTEDDSLTGGIYGSHFLYMIQGGFDEEKKRLQTRIYGTQGTHFLTNLVSNNVIYGYIAPTEDILDSWFFTPSPSGEAVCLLNFPESATIYADSINQLCKVIS